MTQNSKNKLQYIFLLIGSFVISVGITIYISINCTVKHETDIHSQISKIDSIISVRKKSIKIGQVWIGRTDTDNAFSDTRKSTVVDINGGYILYTDTIIKYKTNDRYILENESESIDDFISVRKLITK